MGGALMSREIEHIETEMSVVKCDGGGGVLGHPVIYLNLGEEDKVICPYCRKGFVKDAVYSTTGKRTKGLRRVS